MKVRRLHVQNYKGARERTVILNGRSLLVGSNDVAKSTVCEALELVLGPERMFRGPAELPQSWCWSSYPSLRILIAVP